MLVVETVEVARSDAQRLYVSAVRGEDAQREGFVLTSKDRGAHWTTHKVPLDAAERTPFLAAVDPQNADRVYVRTAGPASSRSQPCR